MLDLRPRHDFKTELDLTPFMDVIFILLLFFIIASAFAVRGLEIRLNEDGSFLCDGVPVERAFLRYKLQDIVRGFRKTPGQLVLKAAPKAPVDALVFVVDEVRMLGGEKLMVATSRPGDDRAGSAGE